MDKLIGYSIVGIGENDKGMMEDFEPSEEDFFSDLYQINYVNDHYKVRAKFRKYDWINTYDGYTLVSENFKQFCLGNEYVNIEFITLKSEPEFYWMKVNNIVAFDYRRYGTEFLKANKEKTKYWGAYGATPAMLKTTEKLEDGFYRTDLCFGDGCKKNPVIVIGIETRKKIKESNFKGIYYKEVLSK